VVVAGLAGFVIVVVNEALVYQVAVPEAQVAESVELCPAQIVAGVANTAVGANGVGLTVKVTLPDALLHPEPLTQAT
jgi:purine nucleoside phosphorylase